MRVWMCESVEGWREITMTGNYKEAMSYVAIYVHPTHIPVLPIPLPDPPAGTCIYNVYKYIYCDFFSPCDCLLKISPCRRAWNVDSNVDKVSQTHTLADKSSLNVNIPSTLQILVKDPFIQNSNPLDTPLLRWTSPESQAIYTESISWDI